MHLIIVYVLFGTWPFVDKYNDLKNENFDFFHSFNAFVYCVN